MISIYIHIPFCVRKCDYCAFYSIQSNDEIFEQYTNALIAQIDSFNFSEQVKTIYFGGGTPSIIGSERLNKILYKISNKFDISSCEEITLEINPRTTSFNDLVELNKGGFNRLSIGLQSTNNVLLESIGRIHSYEDFLNTYDLARKANFNNISVDLMYGLPDQALSDHLASINQLTQLDVQHISVYGLTVEPETKMYKFRDSYNFPDEDEEFEMYLSTSEFLVNNGFLHYEISNFSKKGFESKHNIGYWSRREYLGFGPSSHSYYNNKRFSCNLSVLDYIDKSKEYSDYFSYTDYSQQKSLTQIEIEEEKIMLGLRTASGIELNYKQASKAKLYIDSGYMKEYKNRYSFTPSGWYVSNTIITNILSE